jgi:predicted transcriptional regulator
MSHPLTIELSDAVYARLQLHAQETAQSPSELAAATLAQRFGAADGIAEQRRSSTETEKQAARERFERHFGAVNLGDATGTDNEGIDADLARAYADSHEEG